MKKKTSLSTFDRLMLDPARRKRFDEGYESFLLSEIIAEGMDKQHLSVRKLAKQAGVSPTVIQEIRSGTKKNLTLASMTSILANLKMKLIVKGQGKEYPLTDELQSHPPLSAR